MTGATNHSRQASQVSAVVLAAGLSRRMGTPKMILPWGRHTVIEQVVTQLMAAGIGEIVIVTGGAQEQLACYLQTYPVKLAFNPAFAQGEMLSSLQVGMGALAPDAQGLLVVLGDQPAIQVETIRQVVGAWRQAGSRLVVPSYNLRRGHPWLVDRALWPELLAMDTQETMRNFLNQHQDEILYVPVDSASILLDIDTPEDYQSQKPV